MTLLTWLLTFMAAIGGLKGLVTLLKKYKIGMYDFTSWEEPDSMPSLDRTTFTIPVEPPKQPVQPMYLWNTPKDARHSVRLICDEVGLPLEKTFVLPDLGHFMPKDIICAVIEGESGFRNTAKRPNKNKQGLVTSTDWGLCQINDRFHIGPNNDFPSVDYVLENPDKVVRWMIAMYRADHLDWWVAYKNNSYKQYL